MRFAVTEYIYFFVTMDNSWTFKFLKKILQIDRSHRKKPKEKKADVVFEYDFTQR